MRRTHKLAWRQGFALLAGYSVWKKKWQIVQQRVIFAFLSTNRLYYQAFILSAVLKTLSPASEVRSRVLSKIVEHWSIPIVS